MENCKEIRSISKKDKLDWKMCSQEMVLHKRKMTFWEFLPGITSTISQHQKYKFHQTLSSLWQFPKPDNEESLSKKNTCYDTKVEKKRKHSIVYLKMEQMNYDKHYMFFSSLSLRVWKNGDLFFLSSAFFLLIDNLVLWYYCFCLFFSGWLKQIRSHHGIA